MTGTWKDWAILVFICLAAIVVGSAFGLTFYYVAHWVFLQFGYNIG